MTCEIMGYRRLMMNKDAILHFDESAKEYIVIEER
jgi:hypothetical protein